MQDRIIDVIKCSCGGEVEEVNTTDEDEKEYGCGRRGCCVTSLLCNKCGVRFTIAYESPEPE